jgi:hypothetical protein
MLLSKDVFNKWMYILGACILIIGLLRKLYELLEYPSGKDFLKTPFFYILIATLLFYTVTIPNFILHEWIYNAHMGRLTAIVNNVFNFLNIFLYATYSIAFYG